MSPLRMPSHVPLVGGVGVGGVGVGGVGGGPEDSAAARG